MRSHAPIVAPSIFGFYAKIRVFRPLDQASSVSGSKVMPKNIPNVSGIPEGLQGGFH